MPIIFIIAVGLAGAKTMDNYNKCINHWGPQTDEVVAYCDNLAEIGEIDNLGWMDIGVGGEWGAGSGSFSLGN